MGMPDKMIAFDELPEDLLTGLDMVDESKLPRHWKDFIGKRKKYIRIAPDRDPMTGQMRTYTPLVIEAPYSYVIDWEINSNKERWSEISAYVQRNAPKDFRLKDKLEDMASPMAADSHSELTLEPEFVPVIPLPKNVVVEPEVKVSIETFKCETCSKEFDKRQALNMHKTRVHRSEEAKI